MEEIDSKSILENYGLFMDDISQIRVVDSKSADSARNYFELITINYFVKKTRNFARINSLMTPRTFKEF